MVSGETGETGGRPPSKAKTDKAGASAKKPSGSADGIAVYQLQVITTILHILGNLRHSGMELLYEVELYYQQILVIYALLENGSLTVGELADQLKV